MKSSMKTTLITALLAVGIFPAGAQTKKAPAKSAAKSKTVASKSKKGADGFTVLPSGLEFKIVTHGAGGRKPVVTDRTELFIHVHVDDSVIFDSRKMYNPIKPVPVPIAAPKFKGDPMEGFMLMAAGDSAVMRLSVDSMKKAGNQLMPWMKEGAGQKIEYDVFMVAVRTEAEEKKANEESAGKQKGIDEKMLKDYFEKNNIKASKTASGLYYVVTRDGTGPEGKAGQMFSVNYTGRLLNGKTFDSNTDTAFHHPEPFSVEIGKGNVIRGWDEGLQLLKAGSKATLYIPSGLAYGPQDKGAQIPANSILVFDVEILSIENKVSQSDKDDKILKSYFEKNNIKATKTASGLYYTIAQKGLGPNAKPGKKVTMNYTGKLLDGKEFDSNTDPKFNHVSPFSFVLGQGQVIKGWDEGVQLLNIGTKGTLYIPSGLGYGPNGMGGSIPQNAVLVFDVELVSIDN
jgi:FKBP-type peptidyl-prolyl cis-trans isomerase FkpA